MKATLLSTQREGKSNIYSFWFKCEKPLHQIAGQYIELTIQNPKLDSSQKTREFTISSSPINDLEFSITTRISQLHSDYKDSLINLEPGDTVLVTEPMGDFVLPKDHTLPLVFIAAGVGITPFHAIIKWLTDTRQSRDITFLYTVSTTKDIVFSETLNNYGLKRKTYISDDSNSRRLGIQEIIKETSAPNEALFYISGPQGFVDTIKQQLLDHGINQQQLVTDTFFGYEY